MPWPDDMFAGAGGPSSPGALDTYGLGDDDYFSTLASIDEQLRAPLNPLAPPVEEPPTQDAITAAAPPTTLAQPGIGIPASAFDAAMQPAQHERDVDARTLESADRQLAQPIDDVKPDYEATPLDLPTEGERGEALKKMSSTDFAQFEIKHELARRDQEATALLEASRKEREQAEADHEIALKHQEARAQEAASIQLEAKRLADEKIDPDGWRNSRSTAQTIAGFLSVIVGGFGGGPNTGLQMLNTAMEQNIDAQKTNLANKRAALGDRRAALGEQQQSDAAFERQANTYRIATYERAIRDISTEQMKYDPQGTTAIALEKSRRQIVGAQAKALQQAAEDAAKRQTDALKLAYDLRKTAAETAKLEAEAAKMRGAGAGAGKKEDDVVRSPEEWAALGVNGVPGPMSMKQLKKLQPLMKGGQEIAKNDQEIASGKATMSKEQRENAIPGIANPDGQPFIAVGRPEDVSKLRSAKAAADNMVKLMDEALRVRTGWTSNVGNSKERQQLKVIWGNVKLGAKKLFDLGAITESDVPLIEGSIGTDDPSSWKDPTEAILEARRQVLDGINNELHAAGWDKGQRYDIKAPPTDAPKEAAEDSAFKNALRKPRVSQVKADTGDASADLDADDLDRYVFKDVQRMLDDLVDRGKGAKDGATREAVAEQLRAVIKNGGNTGTKDAARRALAVVEGGDLTPEEQARRGERTVMPSVEPVGGPKGSVSYETVPPAPGAK